MTVLHIRVNMLNKGIRCKFHLKRLSNFPKKCGNRHDLHSAPSPLSGKPGRLILGHFWVPSNRFQSLSWLFDISSYTGRSRKKSKDDFSSMEKVKQIVLFVKRQTHERRHLGFVGNLTEETFFYVIYTLRLICTPSDYHSLRKKILLPDRFGQILCRIELIS